MRSLLISIAFCFSLSLSSQVLTREDSLNAGLVASDRSTVISGYGEAKVTYDLKDRTGEANLTRNVLFVGHKFNDKISLFTELEVEDAKVAGGEPGGEVAIEQVFVKFNATKRIYICAGLIIPRIGIINENHLPTSFNGASRNQVETKIIPATWREIGVAVYGQCNKLPGLNWSFGLYNGLNSSAFGGGEGIREGRFEGREATATNLAVSGALLFYTGDFRMQVSSYFGGSAGLSPRDADSLQLYSGAFGTPVMVNEANIQYFGRGFGFKLLGTVVNIPDADRINLAYANNTPEMMYGAYGEVSYNLLALKPASTKTLAVFARYEVLDLDAKMPENGIKDEFVNQTYIVGGITFAPVHGVAVKLDYTQRMTGEINPALQINPFINGAPFYASRGYASLGIAYSF
jgi:hypothetical protein